jgi:hypothetical protein
MEHNMKTNEEPLYALDLPQLRVYWEQEDSEVDDRQPPDNDPQGDGDWAHIEAYWAGRNHARRRSARIAA